MQNLTKRELKDIAISKGLLYGFNGRTISRMRKGDFIDFLQTKEEDPEIRRLREDNFVLNLRLSIAKKNIDRLTDLITVLSFEDESPNKKTEPSPIETNETLIQCPVCLTNKINTVLTCTHVICNICFKNLEKCPLCREQIQKHKVSFCRI